MWEFLTKHKKKILSVIFLLLCIAAISFVCFLVLRAFGILYYDDGLCLNATLFDSFKNSWYGWILVILLQVIVTSLLSFIPGTSMAFILLVDSLYDQHWKAFIISFSGVMISSFSLYALGRFGGYKLCKKFLGEDDCKKASYLLNHKGAVYFPLMMMFPAFPDDALVMIAGTLKMTLGWFVPSIVFGRGIGVATIVFGMASIPYDQFTSPWHWIAFIVLCAIFLIGVFYLAYRLNEYLEKKNAEHSKTK